MTEMHSESPHKKHKEKTKVGHRRVSTEGTVTYKRKTTSDIQTAIQLGIRISVTLSHEKVKRDMLLKDFGVVETMSFPRSGSKDTPSHDLNDFKFKTFAPIAFRYFRDVFQVNVDEFVNSLCKQDLQELSNAGASGSIFYITYDDEFIIKTVQHKEANFLQKLLPEYYINLIQHPRTLLPKFYGLYCYQTMGKNIRFVIMNNLLPSITIHEKYDLKGSTYKRLASSEEKAKNSPTLKDLDFKEKHPEGLFLEVETYEALLNTIQRDCRVLESFSIMDYSLLLGIHNLDQGKRARHELDEVMAENIGNDSKDGKLNENVDQPIKLEEITFGNKSVSVAYRGLLRRQTDEGVDLDDLDVANDKINLEMTQNKTPDEQQLDGSDKHRKTILKMKMEDVVVAAVKEEENKSESTPSSGDSESIHALNKGIDTFFDVKQDENVKDSKTILNIKKPLTSIDSYLTNSLDDADDVLLDDDDDDDDEDDDDSDDELFNENDWSLLTDVFGYKTHNLRNRGNDFINNKLYIDIIITLFEYIKIFIIFLITIFNPWKIMKLIQWLLYITLREISWIECENSLYSANIPDAILTSGSSNSLETLNHISSTTNFTESISQMTNYDEYDQHDNVFPPYPQHHHHKVIDRQSVPFYEDSLNSYIEAMKSQINQNNQLENMSCFKNVNVCEPCADTNTNTHFASSVVNNSPNIQNTRAASGFNRQDSRMRSMKRIAAYSTVLESIQAPIEQMDLNSSEEEIIPSGGIPARNSAGDRLILFMGIIDILQSYRLAKKMEHNFKSIFLDPDSISVCNPTFYALRFQDFFGDTVFKKITSSMKTQTQKVKKIEQLENKDHDNRGVKPGAINTNSNEIDDKVQENVFEKTMGANITEDQKTETVTT